MRTVIVAQGDEDVTPDSEMANGGTDITASDAQSADFVDWPNPPTISDLQQNIDDAEIDQEDHKDNVARWSNTRDIKRPKVEGRSSVAPKVVRKQNEWRYSSLADPFLSTPDLFNVTPTTAGDRDRALQNQEVLNYQFNTQIKKTAFIDSYVHEAVDVGTVIVKLGWVTEVSLVTRTVPIYNYLPATGQEAMMLAQQYAQLVMMRKQSPDAYGDMSTPGLDHALDLFMKTGQAFFVKPTGEEREITEQVETKNCPTLEIPNSDNIIFDPSCGGDLDLASFIGEKFKASVGSLKEDGKYKNLDKIELGVTQDPTTDPDYTDDKDVSTFTFKDKTRKQFVVYTYWGEWDIRGDGTTEQIVCSWVDAIMIRLELCPFPDNKPPFVKAVYMPVRESMFGEPDAELLEDNQAIIGAVTRGSIDLLAKSANAQTGMRKDMLDVTNDRRFKNGQDYEFNANSDPRQGVFQHTYPEVPRSAYDMIMMQNIDAESLTGVKAFATGSGTQGLGDTATEARGALDAASKRELGILRRLAAGIVDIGRKVIAMNSEFLSEEETIRITDGTFIQVRRDDLTGSYDVNLSISTAEEDAKKASELAFMYQTGNATMDQSFSRMILADIARLRKMPDFAKRIEEYQPEPDPIVVAKAQKELELLDAQIEKERALANKHNAEAAASGGRGHRDASQGELNMAKVGETNANARQTQSEADTTDQEYLDNASGKTHLRDIDKITQQSNAQANAKIKEEAFKSLLLPPESDATE